MRPAYLLDTNICIYLMKHHPPQVAARFAGCYVGEVVISAITLAELEYGVVCSGSSRARNRQALDRLLEDIPPPPSTPGRRASTGRYGWRPATGNETRSIS